MSWVTNLILHVSSAEGKDSLSSPKTSDFLNDALSKEPIFPPNMPPELKSLVQNTLGNIKSNINGFRNKIEQVNAFFVEREWPELASIEPVWQGKGKSLECNVYVGAYSQLDIDAFIEHLRGIEWRAPEFIQLFVKDQEDIEFRLVRIAEPKAF